MAMDIILTEDVPKLGEMGDIVKVAPGYGRNYLIPQGLAIPATLGNKKELDHQLAIIEKRKMKAREEAQKILGDVDAVSISISKRVGEEDSLYGSVTDREIADALSAQTGQEIHRKQVLIPNQINTLGIYKVPVKLASGVYANVLVWVVAI